MRRFLFPAILLAATAFGQETKGSITMTKTGDAEHTVVSLSSITPGPLQFVVTLRYRAEGAPLESVQTKAIGRFTVGPKTPPTVLAIFDVPLTEVVSVGVSQYVLDEGEIFN